LLASHIAETRTTKDAYALVKLASQRAGKTPKVIITDRLASYVDAIEMAFGADTKHIQSKPFVDVNSTNIIERFHSTLKDRLKVIRSFRNMETARLLTDAWLVYYNFMKEHQTLGNVPPAQKMGKVPISDWNDVIRPKSEVPLSSAPRLTIRAVKRRKPKIRRRRKSPSPIKLISLRIGK
jgi:IS1 family transposase